MTAITGELDKALAVRLEKYRSHYEDLDKIQGDWLAGAQDGLANWIDTSSDYYSQVSGLVGNTWMGWLTTWRMHSTGIKRTGRTGLTVC